MSRRVEQMVSKKKNAAGEEQSKSGTVLVKFLEGLESTTNAVVAAQNNHGCVLAVVMEVLIEKGVISYDEFYERVNAKKKSVLSPEGDIREDRKSVV